MPPYSTSLALLRSSPFVVVCLSLYVLAFLCLLPRPTFHPASSTRAPNRRPAVEVDSDETPPDVGSGRSKGIGSLWPGVDGAESATDGTNGWKAHNAAVLHELFGCLAKESCTEKQTQVVVLEADEFRRALLGWTSGEGIWARSIMEVFDSLGYTYLFARDMDHAGTFQLMLPELIKAVVGTDRTVKECADSSACTKTDGNPMGIPVQKLFSLAFFGGQHNPLGGLWTLTPEGYDDKDHTYLGYTIEHDCMATDVLEYAEKKRQVWVFGKHHRYFLPGDSMYNEAIFVKASKALDVEFIGAWDDDAPENMDPVPGVTRLGNGGQLNETEFIRYLSGSLATIGLGNPYISPTPYYSVCYGVPFLNPVQPNGNSQHPYAGEIRPEDGVYPVAGGDDDDFIRQLRLAIQPHPRYIPPWMTHKAMEGRVERWLATNWTEKAVESGVKGNWVL